MTSHRRSNVSRNKPKNRPGRKKRRRFRPLLEQLENRWLLAFDLTIGSPATEAENGEKSGERELERHEDQ